MGKSQSKPDGNIKKLTTRRLKLGVKFGKDADGGIESCLACGYEKKVDKFFTEVNKLETIPEEENK